MGEETHVMHPDMVTRVQNLAACLTGSLYFDVCTLSSTSMMIASEISPRYERGTDHILIPQSLVEQTSAAAFWHRLLCDVFVVVDPEALFLGSLPFDSDKTTSDPSCPKRRRMY